MKINVGFNWSLTIAFALTIFFGFIWLIQFYQVIHLFHTNITNEVVSLEEALQRQDVQISTARITYGVETARQALKQTITSTTLLLLIIFSIIIILAAKAREIDRMKSEFVSVAGHQLRTPITAIRWHGEMLLNRDLGPICDNQKTSLERIRDSIVHMASLVNDLLNVARVESGHLKILPIPTDPVVLTKKILENFETTILEKNLQVKTIFEDIGKVDLDPELIGEALHNLISNAVKYSPIGSKINLSIKNVGKNFLVEIKDHGPGIPISRQDEIFSKFFRAENAVLIDTEGNGLGLYIAKTIIESSKGKIWFETKENKGTTFWFLLPKSGIKNIRS